jgi:hypothetical protein
MPRRPGRRPTTSAPGGADADADQLSLAAWGLEPAQWRPVGSLTHVGPRAVCIWRLDGAAPPADVALRARRAYDRLGELGVTLAADETPRGIEVTMPLSRVGVVLRTLGEWAILPDVVCIDAAPADELRRLRREIAAWRGRVTLEIGTHEQIDPLAQLRARARLS